MPIITESHVEETALAILEDIGYQILHGPDITEGGPNPERKYSDVILTERLRKALAKINPKIPAEEREKALKQILRTSSQNMAVNNSDFHKMAVDGVDIEYRKDSRIVGDKVWLFDFDKPENNEFLAINQFTIIENRGNIENRRPDIILFVNGIPLVIIELKNIADEDTTIKDAFNQFQTYKLLIPGIFRYNEILVGSDGNQAKAGTITSEWERFIPWKDKDAEKSKITQMEVLLREMLNKKTLLDLIRHFIVFEENKDGLQKKIAAYHQYYAVNKAIKTTKEAVKGDKRAGVVWHTQGSGKSLSMVFYAGKLVLDLDNPTILMLTDRNDLDGQLFDTFSKAQELLRQKPAQADSRDELKKLLKVASGGIIFTTIQKFLPDEKGGKFPLLSDRSNIVVVADEAHRSQYDFIDGFAKHLRDALPNASFIGFTGTPIEKADKNTPAVFGDYVDVYDIHQSYIDGTTVKIYYESRLAKLELKPEERPKIDANFEEVTEGEETANKEKLKSKWARVEAVVGSKKRIKRIAKDIVKHFEGRLETIKGKGMIVCMSRRICFDLHNEIIKLKPDWYEKDDKKGFLKVIMTGSATDPAEWQEHIRNKKRRMEIGDRMKDANDPLKLTIVRDMWLTGFDVPSMHTMYLDKPMKGHGLMQAIARVNRVYKDKPGGLIVDYIGIAPELKKALADYSKDDKKDTGLPLEEAISLMDEKCEVVRQMFHGFNYKSFFSDPPKTKFSIIPGAMDFIIKQKEGKERYLKNVTELTKSFALVVPHEEALDIKEEVGFFQVVRSQLVKTTETKGKENDELDSAINQIISKALVSDRVIDIFESAGIKKPDVSILSEEFLADVKIIPHKNLAFEMLKKLLNEEIKIRSKKNVVQARLFSELLDKAIKRYTNKAIEAAQVIEELIELAKKMKADEQQGVELGLSEDEKAFYDALEVNDSAVKVLGEDNLKIIAKELVETVRKNVTIDWTSRESVQAKLRVMVKRILKKHGYPPDKQQKAIETVLEQAQVIGKDWAEAIA